MMWMVVILLVIAAAALIGYMSWFGSGAPSGGDQNQAVIPPEPSEEEDLQAIQVEGLDQGLQDIEKELAP